jgi:hypothetical protein
LDRRTFLLAAASAAGGALVPSVPALAAQIDNVRFEDRLKARDVTLKLQGAGLFYYKVLFKAAAAALYLDDRTRPTEVLSDVAKRLEMEYFWSVKATDLIAASKAILARNIAPERLAALQPQVDAMHALYQDVASGDRCSLTYLPGVGTWLTHRGKILGTVPGPEFASAYFSIWFGDKPMDAGLKQKLLGL